MPQQLGVITICNQALGKVGARTIIAFPEENKKAGDSEKACANFYPTARDATLESHDWSFARYRISLTPTGEPEANGRYQYVIPPDMLVPRQVFGDPRWDWQLDDWQREGEWILATPAGNDTTIWVKYTRRIEDTTRFSSLFTAALVSRLGHDLVGPLAKGSQRLRRDLWAEYMAKLDEATPSDGQQGRSQRMQATLLTSARGRGGRGPFAYGPRFDPNG